MSDFLAHLVSRSITPVPSVQPRLASRFEAIAPASDATLSSPFAPEQFETAIVPSPNLQPPRWTDSFPQAHLDPPNSLPYPAQPRQSGEISHTVQSLGQQSPKTTEPMATSRSPRAIASPASPQAAPQQWEESQLLPLLGQSSEQPSISSHISELTSSDHRIQPQSPQSEGVRSLAEPQPMIQVARLRIETPLPTGSQTVSQGVSSGVTPTQLLPVPLQAERLATLPSRLPTVPAPEVSMPPTIQVTIGRIEVRATAQMPAAKPASATAKPTLTLDQYLRQRTGGRA